MQKNAIRSFTAGIMTASLLAATYTPVCAAESSNDEKFYLGVDSLVNTGKDTGFSESHLLNKDDPHWDWKLGEFYVSGYTRASDLDGDPLFLKNVDDPIFFSFSLEQNIDRLNNDENLRIYEDSNGWDQKLEVPQQNFGRGMLIVKHTDYLNHSTTTTYQDFLKANSTETANTKIDLLEEGDYEIALDYEIQKTNVDLFGWKPFATYTNYRISFEFSVRNGNCMVFPFDVTTGAELTNAAVTENGFYLDMAKSRYLDIDIKRETLAEDGLTEDVRFNRPAQDGSQYTQEGIYTITVRNRYTDQTTTKVIYVGTNKVLKAYAATGLPIQEIQTQLTAGATIAEDGTIIPPERPSASASEMSSNHVPTSLHAQPKLLYGWMVAVCVFLVLIIVLAILRKRHVKKVAHHTSSEEGDDL